LECGGDGEDDIANSDAVRTAACLVNLTLFREQTAQPCENARFHQLSIPPRIACCSCAVLDNVGECRRGRWLYLEGIGRGLSYWTHAELF
jgi:hypothetical protein